MITLQNLFQKLPTMTLLWLLFVCCCNLCKRIQNHFAIAHLFSGAVTSVVTKAVIHQNSKERFKEGYSASTIQVWANMAEVWSQEIKAESLLPCSTSNCDHSGFCVILQSHIKSVMCALYGFLVVWYLHNPTKTV